MSTTTSTQSSKLCNYCNQRPKFSNHPFCSKTCARKAALCNNCHKKPKYQHFDYCGKTCAAHANPGGRGRTHANIESKETTISKVHSSDPAFESVAGQFKASWRHKSACPHVRRVYKIISPPASLIAYQAYREKVEFQGNFKAAGQSTGNERRRWHGTRRACNLGDREDTRFCLDATCSLCSIIRGSYDISLWGARTDWGRFGKGIYTSSTSSKSNDYSHNDYKSSWKAMLLNNVVVGKGFKLRQDDTTLTAPPEGYDSVLGETGKTLNHDELVVYTNDAIRPSYLVMYDNPAT